MKQNYFNFNILLPLSFIILTGCTTVRIRKHKKHFRTVESSQLTEKVNILEKTVSNQDMRLSDLSFQMKQLIETNNNSVRKINQLATENLDLKKRLAVIERENTLLAENAEKDRKNHTAENNRMLNEIIKKTTALINTNNGNIKKQLSQYRTQQTNTKSNSLPGNMKGSYYEYTVQQGATLAAIAKAYKVTVSDIKHANNLKNNIIRIGQKLYIPKK